MLDSDIGLSKGDCMEVMVLIVLGTSLVVNVILVYLLVVTKSRSRKPPEHNNKLMEADVSRVLLLRSRLSLKERMADLGLDFYHYPSINYISADIRHAFIEDSSGKALCRRCHNHADLVQAINPVVNPCNLGYFCTNCGEGRLFENIGRIREASGLPTLPDGNMFAILNVLERSALEHGLIRGPVDELPQNSTFSTVVQNSGDYRKGVLKVRVDVATQTVVLENEAEQPGQLLRLIK
ncbi:MAG: hypothetical protein WC551_07055 [Patescibacteria group bacterium]